MVAINVQFSDSAESAIVAYFASPQDPAVFPNQEQIDTGDARYATFFNSIPTLAKQGMPVPG
jgi:hypothetical protein